MDRGPYRSGWAGSSRFDADCAWSSRACGRSGEKAIERAHRFVVEPLDGDDGLGAIYPAMANR